MQHKYHTKIDEQIEKISGQMSKDVVGKLVQVWLSRWRGEEGNLDDGAGDGEDSVQACHLWRGQHDGKHAGICGEHQHPDDGDGQA